MNFVSSEFWWTLLGVGGFLLTLRWGIARWLGGCIGFDRWGLLLLSLLLFWFLSPLSFSVLVLEGLVSYGVIQVLQRRLPNETPGGLEKGILAGGVLFLLAILAMFKYGQPAAIVPYLPGLSALLATVKLGVVPPGLSFHTFQLIGSLVDAYRGRLSGPLRPVDYANFVFLFPQATSGPIERWERLGVALSRFRISFAQFEAGLGWMVLGLFMKLVMADNLMRYTRSPISSLENAWCIWIYVIFYGLRLYFDFAGYSFIALGLGKMFGIDLPLNFRSPYSAVNLQDFWRRWNITLMQWFRDYLFIPLGGSRVPWAIGNVLIVFLASGIWHGSTLNYLLWGAYHGVLMILYGGWKKIAAGRPWISPRLGRLLTLIVIFPGWTFFVESNSTRLLQIWKTLLNVSAYGLENLQVEWGMLVLQSPTFFYFLLAGSLIILGMEGVSQRLKHETPYDFFIQPRVAMVLLGLTVLLANPEPGQFIYFAF